MLKSFIVGLVAAASVTALACGSSSTPGDVVYHESEQENATCPTMPTILTGTAAEGAACKAATDCKPTCCPCATGQTGEWLAAECKNSTCQAATACADTEQASFCK